MRCAHGHSLPPLPRDRACAFPLNRRHLKTAHARLPRGCAITFVCACAAAVRSDFSYLRMRGLAWRQRMRSPALLETRRLRTFDRGSAFPARMRLIGSVFVLHVGFKRRGRRGNGACALIPPHSAISACASAARRHRDCACVKRPERVHRVNCACAVRRGVLFPPPHTARLYDVTSPRPRRAAKNGGAQRE